MHTTTTVHANAATTVTATFLQVEGGRRFISFDIEGGSNAVQIFCNPEFLDKLANECERAVREFVGDVP